MCMIALWALIKFIILIQTRYSYKELSWAFLNDNSKETVCKCNMYNPNLASGFQSFLVVVPQDAKESSCRILEEDNTNTTPFSYASDD